MLITTLTILQIFFAFSFLAILGYLAFVMASFKNLVPYVPTPKKVIKRMIQLSEIKSGDRACDLGSGTGRIIILLGKKHTENLIIGIEKSFILRLVAKIRLLFHPFIKKRIQILNQDFFNIKLEEFDVIFCFLIPAALEKLAPSFSNLKSGSKIISYMFPIKNKGEFKEEIDRASDRNAIFLYQKI